MVYVARMAITKRGSKKCDKKKTDMFSLGFICEIKKFETPKEPKTCLFEKGREGVVGKEGSEWRLQKKESSNKEIVFSFEFSPTSKQRLGTEGTGTWQRALGDRALGIRLLATCSWTIWHMLATCLMFDQVRKK